MKDPREAAKRLLSGGHFCSGGLQRARGATADAMSLAAAYLAEHPEDHETTINRKWLTSVTAGADSVGGLRLPGSSLVVVYSGNGWRIHTAYDDSEVCELRTRGELRKLCSAIGVSLREPTQIPLGVESED